MRQSRNVSLERFRILGFGGAKVVIPDSHRSTRARTWGTRCQRRCNAATAKICLCRPYDIHANSRSLRSRLGYSCGDIVVQFHLPCTVSQNSSQQKLVLNHLVKRLFPLLAVELLALCVKPVSITGLSAVAVASCARSPISPAAVLFFLGAPFPLLFAICKCSKRSSSSSL